MRGGGGRVFVRVERKDVGEEQYVSWLWWCGGEGQGVDGQNGVEIRGKGWDNGAVSEMSGVTR